MTDAKLSAGPVGGEDLSSQNGNFLRGIAAYVGQTNARGYTTLGIKLTERYTEKVQTTREDVIEAFRFALNKRVEVKLFSQKVKEVPASAGRPARSFLPPAAVLAVEVLED